MKLSVGITVIHIVSILQLQGVFLYTPEKEELVRFMELHNTYCNMDLCTVKANLSPELTKFQIPCCRSCSCEKDCVKFGSCCPDYWLQQQIGNKTFQTFEEISQVIKHLNTSDLPDQAVLPSENDVIIDTFECIEAKAITHDPYYKSLRQTNAYWMIDKCPTSFKDTSTVAKCTIDQQSLKLIIKEHWQHRNYTAKAFHDILAPITSLRTKITYRNIYCLKCNGERIRADDTELWTASLSCSWGRVHEHEQIIKNPYVLLEQIVTKQIKACNFVFKPTQVVRGIVAKCYRADIYQCPENSGNLTDYLCRHYNLPVTQINSHQELISYKNIACYICNENKTFEVGCKHFYPSYTESNFEMNFLHDKNKNLVHYNESEEEPLLIPADKKRNGKRCGTGFLMDHVKKCRRILCPRHFYPLNGACIPMFTTMENINFAIMVIVRPLQKLRMDLRDKFDEEVHKTIESIAAEMFERFSFEMWQLVYKEKLVYNLVKLSFSTVKHSIAYIDMLTKVKLFQTKVARLTLDIGVDVIHAEVREVSTEFFEKLGELYDSTTGISLKRIQKRENVDPSKSEWIIKLKYHICYRVELDFEEIFLTRVSWNIIKRNGVKIGKYDAETTEEWKWRVCIEDIFQNLKGMKIQLTTSSMKNSVKTTQNPKKTDYIKQNSNFDFANAPKEIVLSAVFAFVGIIIFAVKAYKYVKSKFRQEA